MIVVDTNIVVYFFIASESTKSAEELFKKDSDWHVPYLWRSEFRNAIAGYMRLGGMTEAIASKTTEEAENFFKGKEYFVDFKDVVNCLSSSTASAYDCEFVVLAKKQNVPLITLDQKLIKEFPSIAQNIAQFLKSM